MNVAELKPAATVTDEGAVTLTLSLVRVTAVEAETARLRVAVHAAVPADVKTAGEHESPVIVTGGG